MLLDVFSSLSILKWNVGFVGILDRFFGVESMDSNFGSVYSAICSADGRRGAVYG